LVTLVARRRTMRRTALLVAAVLFMAALGTTGAQAAAKPTAGIAQQLDRLGLKYTVTKSGNYSIEYDLDGGRTQTVYVMGKTDKVGSTEIRELWSRAGTMDAAPTQEELQKLLEDSGGAKMGFWALEETDSGGFTIYFSVKVPVYLNDSDLSELLKFTADTADQKEEELFNTDDE
jgi:hypothetical protein